jgi:hypothetical protein
VSLLPVCSCSIPGQVEEILNAQRIGETSSGAVVQWRSRNAGEGTGATTLYIITLRSSTGIEQTIKTTAEHPVYALQQGWVEAGKLQAGDTIAEPSGAMSTITAVRTERHPQGIFSSVYNFRVQDAHTYFVRAEGSHAEPVWVHNVCTVSFAKGNQGGIQP